MNFFFTTTTTRYTKKKIIIITKLNENETRSKKYILS